MKNKHNIKILYVEDEKNIRDMLSKFISRFCSDIFIAENGAEGLELYKEHNPDIVISDIKMPIMSGLEMAKEIKKLNPKQILFFTTAHSESNFLMESIEMQVDGYMLKPVDLEVLSQRLKKTINQISIERDYKAQLEILEEVAYLQNDLLFVLDKDRDIIFANNKTLEFFQVDKFEDIDFSSNLFVEHDGFFTPTEGANCIDELMHLEDNKRVVAMEDPHNYEHKAFLITLKQTQNSQHVIIALSEVTNIKIEQTMTYKKAYTDELTKIANRHRFNEVLKSEMTNPSRLNTKLSMFILDIDFFKQFNDEFGHLVGDEVLIELAQLVSSKTRESDMFARWGGEEFVYLMPYTGIDGARKAAENIRKDIETYSFAHGHKLTCSFGCSEFREDDDEKEFFKRADKALYEAKESGRNRVV